MNRQALCDWLEWVQPLLRDHVGTRALIDAGLRHVLGERRRPARFRLLGASFRGRGLQPEFCEDDYPSTPANAALD